MKTYIVDFTAITYGDDWLNERDYDSERIYYNTEEEALAAIERLKEEYPGLTYLTYTVITRLV